jgi:RNA polymerase sigma factor (TIGR02999 family)
LSPGQTIFVLAISTADAAAEHSALMQSHNTSLTELLQLVAQGERGALNRVFTTLYPELHRIAHARLRSGGGVSYLDTTALVHESFLRMVDTAGLALSDRKHFFTYAAKTMRNIIIELVRERCAQRRGGGRHALQLDTALAGKLSGPEGDASLIAVNDALSALEVVDPALAQIVEMRYFAGYSEAEIADLTGSSERTVRRQWVKARAFLFATLRD